jgi:VIT1/CCC1 family predicted Fe2+/Mn2+ transporter/rubrerythrin
VNSTSKPNALPLAPVRERLLKAWRGEVQAQYVYSHLAERERDPARAALLRELAAGEVVHRERLEARMRALGIEVDPPESVRIPWVVRLQAQIAPLPRLLAAREAAEIDEVGGIYGEATGDPETDRLLAEIGAEEQGHSLTVRKLIAGEAQSASERAKGATGAPEAERAGALEQATARARANDREGAGREQAQGRLDRILGRERWHRAGGGWIAGAIYGANDGLAAVFGIVAGVSGATNGGQLVLTAGLAGAIASALSMATGAFLAERSEVEVGAANLEQERREIAQHPEEEREELALFLQLKGIERAAAEAIAAKLAEYPEAMLTILAGEEFGSLKTEGNAGQAALAGGLSTAAGAIVPVLPFIFMTGTAAFVVAAAVSLVAHFLVGAAKSLVTLRSWWAAGMEMTLAGILVGGVLYSVGLVLPVHG